MRIKGDKMAKKVKAKVPFKDIYVGDRVYDEYNNEYLVYRKGRSFLHNHRYIKTVRVSINYGIHGHDSSYHVITYKYFEHEMPIVDVKARSPIYGR